ncbi:alcohol dehydrogenase catalytic domain-containing protein [Nocardioides cavernae]|uniref:Alcohol dehydrogenase catalytic domain-containing protein n=1 Tax=Nocardioides cavernae TaxID=1921566 RepID=A0ABR8NFN7_9ACTN|nr:alcohol dehydrogenase catalytic domain-containing protein [Nocardioides cavernae]MBD3926933.1 alcohol dehydrogenase catalytic domain-containing protein [Nocardioides cavernae]MBM7512653.1 threonine dehydrogenase-like Zn-dependent dehydrogenase [Nocardioides cavernae]
MTSAYDRYRAADLDLPEEAWAWNLWGAGEENMGKDGAPELVAIPEPDADHMLVRIDSVGLCFSDVKIMRQGGSHPKLYDRDLAKEPTRLGHEVSLTVIEVGDHLKGQYHAGQRLAVQPDIYQDGKSTAYGYTIPGGLIQYHLMGAEMLETDDGACLLPLPDTMGYAEGSTLEPWGCVMAAYTQRRRLEPKAGGTMWIVGRPGDERDYLFSSGLDAPATIVMTDVPASVVALVERTSADTVVRNGIGTEDYQGLVDELTDGAGFDDIVMLDPRSAATAGAVAKHIARRGTLNMVGETALDGLVDTDVGRLHYDYTAYLGGRGPDIAASYGEARNRCDLRPQGTTVFVGAGGPMGLMHVQRAIQQPDGPRKIVATEVSDERLKALEDRLAHLAESNDCELLTFNSQTSDQSLHDFVMGITDNQGADDVVVSVPISAVMAEADTLMNSDGMLVFFAGVPNGTLAPLNLSAVYLDNAQYTGTSGLTIHDQQQVVDLANRGELSPGSIVGAVGGMRAAKDGLQALVDGSYSGKVLIFPQIHDLPLMGLDELKEQLPDVAAKLGPGETWNDEAEKALFDSQLSGSS